jgi:hypothetical protein
MRRQLVGLQVTGAWLAWIMRSANDSTARLALTGDDGQSWTVQALPEGDGLELEAAAVRIHEDGRIDLLAAFYDQVDCGAREAGRYRGRVGSPAWVLARIPGVEDGQGILLPWSAEEIGFGQAGRIHAAATVWGHGRTYAVRTDPDGQEQAAEQLIAIAGRKETVLGRVPEGIKVMVAVDQRGDPLAIGTDRLWRWHGGLWEALAVPEPPVRNDDHASTSP